MNPERIRALADRIQNLADPSDYDHRWYGGYLTDDPSGAYITVGCTVPCCITGHAVLLAHDAERECHWQVATDPTADLMTRVNQSLEAATVGAIATQYLGLDDDTMALLNDHDPLGGLTPVTPAIAAGVLRILADTGEVRWDEAGTRYGDAE